MSPWSLSGGGLQADPAGALLAAGAAVSYAVGCVATRRAALASGAMGTATQMVAGGAMLAVASVLGGEAWSWPHGHAAWALAYLVVCGSMIAYAALGWLLRNTRPSLATSYACVNPLVALALGVSLRHEAITVADGAGLVLVLAAVALVGWAQARNTPARSVLATGFDRSLAECAHATGRA